MRETRDIMGMPVSVEIIAAADTAVAREKVFEHFLAVDRKFSTYKQESEISRINRGEIAPAQYSDEMREVFALADETKRESAGYFDIATPHGSIDPSGLVKGWAIEKAAALLRSLGYRHFYIEAGGDIQTSGTNNGEAWSLGVRNPFDREQIVKVIYPHGAGVATSGCYIRGEHIYDPHTKQPARSSIESMTVIGPNVYEADRFATAAYAMGEDGIVFIEQMPGLEGYAIDRRGIATMTSGFSRYTVATGAHYMYAA